MKIYVASGNKDKISEIQQFFPSAKIIPQKQLDGFVAPVEDGKSFEENSMIKAKALYNFLQNNLDNGDIIIADDSGLLVPSLGKDRLGVYTKREMLTWTCEHNCKEENFWEHIVQEAGIGALAEFPAVISVIYRNGQAFSFKYVLKGKLTYPTGTNGFAFDPILLYEGKTLAERTATEKQLISPRAKALKQVAKHA